MVLEVRICYSKLDQLTAKPASWPYRPKRARTASAEIGQNSMLTVWGKETGERIIADVLVYTLPR